MKPNPRKSIVTEAAIEGGVEELTKPLIRGGVTGVIVVVVEFATAHAGAVAAVVSITAVAFGGYHGHKHITRAIAARKPKSTPVVKVHRF